MLISYNWLKELIPDLSSSPTQVAEVLTMHSFEVEVSHHISLDPQVTVAKIIDLKSHPNADRLRLATVDTTQETITVVCGADNINVGDIVPYSPLGTKLLDDQGQTFTLKTATIRGVTSAGMLNSPRELGLGDWHGGIYLLPPDTPLGTALADHLPPDTILDADITPDRAHDCLNHIGVARELAAILKLSLKEPSISTNHYDQLDDWQLNIDLPQHVLRYLGTALTDVQIKPSPLWLQAKLWALGAKPINNVVDITNYILFELGNPTHAFDSDKLPGRTIGVRFAHPEESITTLDDNQHQLTTDNLIITAEDKQVAVAGVIGGSGSEVTDNTHQIFLEVATFAPYTIQQSSLAIKTDTESSIRFKKGITPTLAPTAASRAISLLQELAQAKVQGQIEYYPHPVTISPISFHPSRVSAIAGQEISPSITRDALQRLRFTIIKKNNSTWQVTAPYDRLDISGEHDLIEEVIRLSGLTDITAKLPTINQQGPPLNKHIQWRETIRDLLAQYGLTEVINYSFANSDMQSMLQLSSPAKPLTIANPVSPEQANMRHSLLPRLAGNLLTNKAILQRKSSCKEMGLFEIGIVFQSGSTGVVPGVIEEEHIGVALVGGNATTTQAQSIVDDILQRMDLANPPAELVNIMPLDSGSRVSQKLHLPVVLLEINLSALVKLTDVVPGYMPTLSQQIISYQPTSKYPPVYRDLSILVDDEVTIEQVQNIIERVGGPTVVDVDLFDTYHPADTDQKSLAFHIAYQSPDKTLTDNEVAALHNKIVSTIKQDLAAQIRE